MYAIRLELKTNWRFILIINVFSFSSKGQTSFKTENNRSSNTYLYFKSYYTESYPVLHIQKE